MPDDLNVDTPRAEGAVEKPTSPASEAAGKSVAGNAADLSELVRTAVEEVLKPIKGEISGLYSRQDKDRNQFREFMDEFRKQKKKGLDDGEAEIAANEVLSAKAAEQKARDDEIAWRKAVSEKLNLSSPQPVGNGQPGAVDVAKVISDVGLDSSDSDAIALAARQYPNEEARELALRRYAMSKKTPTPADQSAPPGNPAPTEPVGDAELLARWEKAKHNPLSPEYKAISAELGKRR